MLYCGDINICRDLHRAKKVLFWVKNSVPLARSASLHGIYCILYLVRFVDLRITLKNDAFVAKIEYTRFNCHGHFSLHQRAANFCHPDKDKSLLCLFPCRSSALSPVQFLPWQGIPVPRSQSLPYKTSSLGSTNSSTCPHSSLVQLHDPLYTATVTHSVSPERKSLSGLRRHHRSHASLLPFSCTWCRHYKEKDKSESEN